MRNDLNAMLSRSSDADRSRLSGLWGFIVYHVLFCYFLFLLPVLKRDKSEAAFRGLIRRALRISFRTFGIEVQLQGLENLNRDSVSVIVANHASWFDQLALLYALEIPIVFAANPKYFGYFGVRHVLRRIGGVAVDPAQPADCLRQCREVLRSGKWLVIFPEGTRSDSLQAFHRGTAVLAGQTGSDVQPIVISGTRQILPRQQSLRLVRPGLIGLKILPLVRRDPEEKSRVFMARLESVFRQHLDAAEAESDAVQQCVVERSGAQPVLSDRSQLSGYGDREDVHSAEEKSSEPGVSTTPSNLWGSFYLLFALAGTAVAVMLSLRDEWQYWLCGQLLLSLHLLQWLAILHESGHKTLLRTRRLNRTAAWIAGFFALIPGDCWRIVHARHHYWTGWQDLDMTTESLVPRQLAWYEKAVLNLCWLLWIPFFATMYRIGNYWNPVRLWRLFPRDQDRRLLMWNIAIYALLYLTVIVVVGGETVLWAIFPAIYLTLVMQDLLILSQHTHIPMKVAAGEDARAFLPREQVVFTRSLIFPGWFARLFLLNFDAHGLHHQFPRVPGYYLHQLNHRELPNCIPWWKWVWSAKRTRAEILLFQNRSQTGFDF